MHPTSQSLRQLELAGLLQIGTRCLLSPDVRFAAIDRHGVAHPIAIGDGCTVLAGAVLHGGAILEEGAIVEEHAVIGKPEHGYAVGKMHTGEADTTRVGGGVVLRAGAVVYGAVDIGPATTIGHHTLLRSHVRIGSGCQLGHHLVVERATRLGDRVRCSPLSHLTSSMTIEDEVFVGARVVTINDKTMVWRPTGRPLELTPPRFEHGARIGSGAVIGAGVTIGRCALVGAAALVTHDVPDHAIVYGVPARIRGTTHLTRRPADREAGQ